MKYEKFLSSLFLISVNLLEIIYDFVRRQLIGENMIQRDGRKSKNHMVAKINEANPCISILWSDQSHSSGAARQGNALSFRRRLPWPEHCSPA